MLINGCTCLRLESFPQSINAKRRLLIIQRQPKDMLRRSLLDVESDRRSLKLTGICARLCFCHRRATRPDLLVTSCMPGEGKTTTAVNTGISLAQTGSKVLVVDADMRRPRVHSIFEIKNQKGLSTILSSDFNEAETMSLINHHEPSGLHVMTAGTVPPNPAELIGSEQMSRLLRLLEPHFAQIIIDSPPIGSFTDGVMASTMVDGVLLVVHSGKTSRA